MKFTINIASLISGFTILVVIVICMPEWIDDSNQFLKSFVGEQLLSALGVILAINLASLAQLHMSLNRLEEKRGERFLTAARAEVKSSARWMIGLFIASVLVVVVKPLVGSDPRALAAMNACAIFILGFYILIMADIIEAVFDLEPDIDKSA